MLNYKLALASFVSKLGATHSHVLSSVYRSNFKLVEILKRSRRSIILIKGSTRNAPKGKTNTNRTVRVRDLEDTDWLQLPAEQHLPIKRRFVSPVQRLHFSALKIATWEPHTAASNLWTLLPLVQKLIKVLPLLITSWRRKAFSTPSITFDN